MVLLSSRSCCDLVQEKGPHPQATLSQAGTFRIPYGGSKVNATTLAKYRAELAKSLS